MSNLALLKNPYVIGGVGIVALILFMPRTPSGGGDGGAYASQALSADTAVTLAGINAGTIYGSQQTQSVISAMKTLENLSSIEARKTVAMYDIRAGIETTKIRSATALAMNEVTQRYGLQINSDNNATRFDIANVAAQTSMYNTKVNADASISRAAIDAKAKKNAAQMGLIGNVLGTVSKAAMFAL